MPRKNVKLNVSRTEKTGSKWKSVTASGGTTFWYKFTGGSKGSDNGDQEFAANNVAETFKIRFKGGDEDEYDFVDFYKDPSTDPDDQLSGIVSSDKKKITVTDACTEPTEGMRYGGTVVDVSQSGSGEEFICDPVITNKPELLA